MFVGSIIGGYIPTLFGSDMLSVASVLGNFIGGIAGVLLAIKLGNEWGME